MGCGGNGEHVHRWWVSLNSLSRQRLSEKKFQLWSGESITVTMKHVSFLVAFSLRFCIESLFSSWWTFPKKCKTLHHRGVEPQTKPVLARHFSIHCTTTARRSALFPAYMSSPTVIGKLNGSQLGCQKRSADVQHMFGIRIRIRVLWYTSHLKVPQTGFLPAWDQRTSLFYLLDDDEQNVAEPAK